jgi:hypothetical protein
MVTDETCGVKSLIKEAVTEAVQDDKYLLRYLGDARYPWYVSVVPL